MEIIKTSLNTILVKLFHKILNVEEKWIRDLGVDLTINEVHVIEAVNNSKTKVMGDIAKEYGVTKGTFSISANRLIKKGYLIRKQDFEDKRIFRLYLTDDAIKILEFHDEFHKKMIDDVVVDLNLEDSKMLSDGFNSIYKFFMKHY